MRLTIWSHWRDERWTGEIPDEPLTTTAGRLEFIFRWFNVVDDGDRERMLEVGYRLPSLSVDDVVTLDGERWRCASVGWVLDEHRDEEGKLRMANIYVPADDSVDLADLIAGSGIVGEPNDERVLVYFEGAKFRPSNIKTWADKVRHAAGRFAANYPTVAMRYVKVDQVEQVGRVRFTHLGLDIAIEVEDRDRLSRWLGDPDDLDAELQYTDRR